MWLEPLGALGLGGLRLGGLRLGALGLGGLRLGGLRLGALGLGALVLAALTLLTPNFATAQETPATPVLDEPDLRDDAPGYEGSGMDGVDARLVAEGDQHLKELEGLPILAVSVETLGQRFEDQVEVRSVEIGRPLRAHVARAALREVLASNRFAHAYADARPYEDGVILRLVAVPRRIIAGIRIEGSKLDNDTMMRAAQLSEEGEITEPEVRRIRERLEAFHRRYGYDDAKIDIATKDTDDDMEVLVTITIEPGERQVVARRVFVIEPELDAVLGPTKHDYAVQAGDPIDGDALIEADNAMVERLREEGFYDAIVLHRLLADEGSNYLYVYLQTGPRYRLLFSGNRRRDAEDLTEALAVERSGVDTTSEALEERLSGWYRDRGFYDVRISVTRVATGARTVDGTPAEVELAFHIIEGPTVVVARRFFTCMPANPPEGLTAEELSDEMDAVLEETLPELPLFHAIDELAIDETLSSNGGGHRADSRQLAPAVTYTRESYAKAIEQLKSLLESRGYLDAEVGPPSVIRAECDPLARAGSCNPLPLPPIPPAACASDSRGLPLPEPPLPERLTCVPDPARSIRCAPELVIHLPIQLGPQMELYDVVFEGNDKVSSHVLQLLAGFPLGAPFSNIELDAARARILGIYKDLGHAYATVRTEVDYSPDRTRARARFIINEHDPVIIDAYHVRGAERTDKDLIISRLALCRDLEACSDKEKYFKQNLVRQSEEQIATLGTFSSVSVALEDPEVPQGRKRVVITVTELPAQYIEPSGGFFTGEGFRVGFEYGHRNMFGQAISATARLQFSILPEFLILDDEIRDNYREFTLSERLERRNTLTVRFPDVGLGPKVDLVINGVDARDIQRDFGLSREALFPTLGFKPIREVSLQFGASTEVNDVELFGAEDVQGAIRDNPTLANLLRVPDGRTIAFAQRLSGSWDRRDKALAATRGTFVTSAVEHVTATPLDDTSEFNSEFLKLTGRFAGYIPLSKGGWAIALSVAGGYNLQLTDASLTYPDRLFYLGGVNNIRGFLLDSVVPEDVAERIRQGEIVIDEVGVRGGDVYWNPRAELRIPLTDLFSMGVFLDAGNLWSAPESITGLEDFLVLRYAAGGGVRLETPLGPVALDYGFNLVRNDWEDIGALAFSIGLF
jgi:outer membrane protein insertion porin family